MLGDGSCLTGEPGADTSNPPYTRGHLPLHVIAMSDIPIIKYIQKNVNGTLQWFAVDADKKTYPMPDEHAEMYNDQHLAICKTSSKYFNASNETIDVYVPKYTGKVKQ